MRDLVRVGYLGAGAHGEVYLTFSTKLRKLIAVKEISIPEDTSESDLEALQNEVNIMRRLSHPNIVRCYGAIQSEEATFSNSCSGDAVLAPVALTNINQDKGFKMGSPRCDSMSPRGSTMHIFMEYISPLNLKQLVTAKGTLSEDLARAFTTDLLHALAYLHEEQCVAHRDLKSANVLISNTGACKLTDFGGSTCIFRESGSDGSSETSLTPEGGCTPQSSCTTTRFKACLGTPQYVAPEVLAGKEVGFSADIYSLGCCLFEMVTGKAPHSEYPTEAALLYALTCQLNTAQIKVPDSANISRPVRNFIDMCVQHDPKRRPSATALLASEWISGAKEENKNVVVAPLRKDSGVKKASSTMSDHSFVWPGLGSRGMLCSNCLETRAIYECDECRRTKKRGFRLCPSCWTAAHENIGSKDSHAKRPLLFPPVPGSSRSMSPGILLNNGIYVDIAGREL